MHKWSALYCWPVTPFIDQRSMFKVTRPINVVTEIRHIVGTGRPKNFKRRLLPRHQNRQEACPCRGDIAHKFEGQRSNLQEKSPWHGWSVTPFFFVLIFMPLLPNGVILCNDDCCLSVLPSVSLIDWLIDLFNCVTNVHAEQFQDTQYSEQLNT